MKFFAIVEVRRMYRVEIESNSRAEAGKRAREIRIAELPLVGELEEAQTRLHSIVEDKSCNAG